MPIQSRVIAERLHTLLRSSLYESAKALSGWADELADACDLYGVGETRWDDLQVAVENAQGSDALTLQQYRDTGVFMRFWRHDQTDTIGVIGQLPHRWQRGTEIKFHLHTIPMAATDGTVAFDWAYTVLPVGAEAGAAASWTTGQATRAIAGSSQYQHRIVPICTIPTEALTAAKESTIIMLRIARNPAADTYEGASGSGFGAANLGLLSLDFHVQVEKGGTITEIPE